MYCIQEYLYKNNIKSLFWILLFNISKLFQDFLVSISLFVACFVSFEYLHQPDMDYVQLYIVGGVAK